MSIYIAYETDINITNVHIHVHCLWCVTHSKWQGSEIIHGVHYIPCRSDMQFDIKYGIA